MTKTVELTGVEVCVTDLGGQNVAVKNLGVGTVYVSTSPNVTAGADGVSEIPSNSGEVIFDAQGTVYILGNGKAQCTGMEYAVPNFKMPSSSESGGGGTGDVTKAYVDAQDSTNLGAAKAYTDTQVNTVKSDISQNADDISALQTGLSDLGVAVSMNTEDIGTLQTDMTTAGVSIAANMAAIASNSNAISEIQTEITAVDSKADETQASVDNLADKSVVSTGGAFDLRYIDNKLQVNVSGTWSDISSGGGETGVSQDYVDTRDIATLASAKAYTATEINAVKEDVTKNADDISELQDDLTSTTAIAEAAQTAADINAENITASAAETLTSAKSYTDTKASALDTRVTANETAISTLNGTGEGSVKKAVADGIAEVVAGAPESFDTLKEISDWINDHADSAAAMNSQIATNAADITALETSKADKTEIPTTLPANGGNADTVNGHTVNADVPADAKFTDTIYSNMQGATETAAGKSGLVPTPPAGALKTYLSAAGGWGNPFAPTVITTVGTDLNTYTTSGIYFFLQNQSPLNAPISGYNGWLLVSTYGSSTAVKQIWFRLGAVGVNDYETFVRTGVNGTWSNWRKFETVAVSAASAAAYGANQEQTDEIMSQLSELDAQSVRPLRAIVTGTSTNEDTDKLAKLEAQAETLRAELEELERGR